MPDISLTAIILTHNEEMHIERCMRSLQPVSRKVFVVDSFSSDRTAALAAAMGAEVVQRAFVNQAEQFQWALDNLAMESDWIMRMDADEYLEPGLQQEMRRLLAGGVADDVAGLYIRRKVFFHGRWIRHGGFYPHTLLRIWRRGEGRVERRWMDEHIVLPPGSRTSMLAGHMVDDNLKGMTFWVQKHNAYASREAVDLLNLKYRLFEQDISLKALDDPQAKWKRIVKDRVYVRLPVLWRSTLYFIYRYVLRLGFLDGGQGFVWHFMQGFWYRMLVDAKIMEIETRSHGDPEAIKRILHDEHGVSL